MARSIVITSGKGGVGKTTITANTGISLAMLDKKVVLVDADIGLNNLDVTMMIEDKIVYDLGDIVMSNCRIKQALIQDDCFPTLYTLPSAKSIDTRKITASIFAEIIEQLSNDFDYILIDCPAGIEDGFHRAVSSAQEAIVVTTPHISAVRDADKVVALLGSYHMKDVSLVVNRLKGNLVLDGAMMDALDIAKLLRIPIKGAIPESDHINIHSQISREKSKKDSVQLAYTLLAEFIDNRHTKVFDCSSDFKGIFKKIRRIFS